MSDEPRDTSVHPDSTCSLQVAYGWRNERDEARARLAASEEERRRHARDAVTLDATQADLRGKLAEAERLLALSRDKVRILAARIDARDTGYELLLDACRSLAKQWAAAAESASVEGGEEYAFRTCSDELAQEIRELGEKLMG